MIRAILVFDICRYRAREQHTERLQANSSDAFDKKPKSSLLLDSATTPFVFKLKEEAEIERRMRDRESLERMLLPFKATAASSNLEPNESSVSNRTRSLY